MQRTQRFSARTLCVGIACLSHRGLRPDRCERMQARLQLADAVERMPRHVFRRQRAGADIRRRLCKTTVVKSLSA